VKTIDTALLNRFIRLAGDRLKGRWVLLGGTLLPLVGIDYRVTTDIDIVGLGTLEQGQTLKLMEIAEHLGLPVESINQAAGYFLSKQESFENHLISLHRGKSAEILRPDLFLFLALKIGRLSESDLTDCLALLKKEGPLSSRHRKTLEARIRAEAKASSHEKRERLSRVTDALRGIL
jgi:hypothetical protein